MSNWPFRFVHAADFHLERPALGISEVPDHLREMILQSAYSAAKQVFDTVLGEEADFLVLSGDLVDPRVTGPRGPLFLTEQFSRLAERKIPVYWAGGQADPPATWPAFVRLPENVHVFPAEQIEEFTFQSDSVPPIRVVGTSRHSGRTVRAGRFDAGHGREFTIAVAYGDAEAEVLRSRAVDYWALGGRHERQTLFDSPNVAHYPGTPQGRSPSEAGPHGVTVVQVDVHREIRLAPVPTDALRWVTERLAVDRRMRREDLLVKMDERTRSLAETAGETDLMISWVVVGDGPIVAELRQDGLAEEILTQLRKRYGIASPVAWSVSLEAEAPKTIPDSACEEDTICGDYLQQVRDWMRNGAESLSLEDYLGEANRGTALAAVASLDEEAVRDEVLRDVATLGIDLLSGEEPQS